MNEDQVLKRVGIVFLIVIVAIISYKFVQNEYQQWLFIEIDRKTNQVYDNILEMQADQKQRLLELHEKIALLGANNTR